MDLLPSKSYVFIHTFKFQTNKKQRDDFGRYVPAIASVTHILDLNGSYSNERQPHHACVLILDHFVVSSFSNLVSSAMKKDFIEKV